MSDPLAFDYNSEEQRQREELSQAAMTEADFANSATTLRVGTFRRNARRLYSSLQPQVLEWPALSCTWLPNRRQLENFRDFSLQTICVGTQAAPGNMNYIACIESAIPFPMENIEMMVREQHEGFDDEDLLDQIPYRRVRGHTRMSQFVGVDGPVLKIRHAFATTNRETVAVRTGASGNVQLFHLSSSQLYESSDTIDVEMQGEEEEEEGNLSWKEKEKREHSREFHNFAMRNASSTNINKSRLEFDRPPFSTDPVYNQPDVVLHTDISICGSENKNWSSKSRNINNNMSRNSSSSSSLPSTGFGLSTSEAQLGRVVAGGDDGLLYLWDIESNCLFVDEDELYDVRANAKKQFYQFQSAMNSAASSISSPRENVMNNNILNVNGSSSQQQQQQQQDVNNNIPRSPNTTQNKSPRAVVKDFYYSKRKQQGPTRLAPVRVLPGHINSICDVSCHGTQPHLVLSGCASGHAGLWDLRVGGEQAHVSGLTSGSSAASLSQQIDNSSVRHEGGCYAVEFHPSASFQVVTGGADGVVKLWDIRRWKEDPVMSLAYHTKPVQRVSWAPFSDSVFASSSSDGLVCLWDLTRGVEVIELQQAKEERDVQHEQEMLKQGVAINNIHHDQHPSHSHSHSHSHHQQKQKQQQQRQKQQEQEKQNNRRRRSANSTVVPKELAFVHAGHASSVVDFAWNPSIGEEWLLASVDTSNMMHIFRPNAAAVQQMIKSDAFDEDMLEEF